MSLVPPIPYFGGKMRLADQIIQHFPEHDSYLEPFAGSLAVLFAKTPEEIEIVNDLDQRLVNFWRVLRDREDELVRACVMTPHSRDEMLLARSGPSDDPVEDARRLFVQFTQTISASATNTGWRVPGTTKSVARYMIRFTERFQGLADRLRNVTLENYPAETVIARYLDEPQMLMYVDPPYMGETRVKESDYRHDMPNEEEHRALLELLLQAQGPVVLSAYQTDLYDTMLEGWDRVVLGARSQLGRTRAEVLYINRTPPNVLFDMLNTDGWEADGEEH